jgi:hypothetical protein
MGYTHYWRIPTTPGPEAFKALVADATTLANAFGREALSEEDGPEFSEQCIRFNGAEPNDYETFLMRSTAVDFEFCKTQFMPYDRLVCAVLIAAKHHLGDGIRISSDGDWSEWSGGQELYQQTFPERPLTSVLSDDDD